MSASVVDRRPSWCGNPKHSPEPHINNGKCDPPVPKCIALVRYNSQSGTLIETPRPCIRDARPDSRFCHFHHRLEQRSKILVTTREGGFCIWCGNPGRIYTSTFQGSDAGPSITLCSSCGTGLFRALEPFARKPRAAPRAAKSPHVEAPQHEQSNVGPCPACGQTMGSCVGCENCRRFRLALTGGAT